MRKFQRAAVVVAAVTGLSALSVGISFADGYDAPAAPGYDAPATPGYDAPAPAPAPVYPRAVAVANSQANAVAYGGGTAVANSQANAVATYGGMQ
ncbi:hypothetical protein [Streptomyces sp. NBC_00212]|uniref:hypothetical protein n=1 Tax=Streptomyces sp. NBC_00212 TaxID=2975684 RepID=UPI003243F8EB